MRIEAKGPIKDMHEGRHYQLETGDQITVPDPLGENWVANGWAKNLDTGEDNAPNEKPVTLAIDNATHSTKSTEI